MKKIILLLIYFYVFENYAQKPSSYKMDFIRACTDSSEKENYIIAVFKVLPIINDFKLILSMRVIYAFGHRKENIVVLKENEDSIKIIIYGKSVEEKSKWMYNFIKDKVDLKTEQDLRLIVFYFKNLTNKKVDEMSITYGLWESNNDKIRNENKYDFKVENCK